MEINIRLPSSGSEELYWQPLTWLLLLYDLQLKTIKPLLQTDYLNKHKWNTTYHTLVITKASECANLLSIHSYMHIIPVPPPERGGQSTTIFQGYFTVFPLSLCFNNTFIKDLSSSLLKQVNSSLRINNLHLQSTSCWLKLIKKIKKRYKVRTTSAIK